ncbi:MAG: LamG-like jellyroll fold domain-containing protein [Verrucomicrobiota bacterium JB024]|nr:LamG-like jellyroll fold domain-containing protein [Verrucomicrobiota bacterium JB024]
MNLFAKLTLPLCTLLAAGSAGAAGPEPVFSFTPEQGFGVETPAGVLHPDNKNLPELAQTVDGVPVLQGATGRALVYEVPDAYSKTEGTLVATVRVPDDINTSDERQTIYAENGKGEELYRFWLLYQGLRFDFGSGRQYGTANFPLTWEPGTWHSVAVTWRAGTGFTLWLDGLPDSSPRMGGGRQGYMWNRWKPTQRPERIILGAADEQGRDAWLGQIADVRLYDRALDADTIRQLSRVPAGLIPQLYCADVVFDRDTPAQARVMLKAGGTEPVTGTLAWTVSGESGETLGSGQTEELTLTPGQETWTTLAIPALPERKSTLRLIWSTGDGQTQSWERLLITLPPEGTLVDNAVSGERKLVASWSAEDPGELPHEGTLTVVDSPLGKYLEAEGNLYSRFHVPFRVEHPGRRHLAVIHYPDDRVRSMEVALIDRNNVSERQLHSGVFTGWEYPNSDEMQELALDFYPEANELGLIFMTEEKDAPAAVASIDIYEVPDVASAQPVKDYAGPEGARHIGVYFEDPQLAESFGLQTRSSDAEPDLFFEGADRCFANMRATGMDVLAYPVAWYDGPLYESQVEPMEPGAHRPHPDGYIRYLLHGLERIDAGFIAGFHLHTLQSLKPDAVRDVAQIYAGEETVYSVYADGTVEMDNVPNHRLPSLYNPLDPELQDAVVALVGEFADDYGQEPALMGIHLRLAKHKIFWFGSGDTGYNDANIAAFERDTGITLPEVPMNKSRFASRYAWLQQNAWEEWIEWRCEQVARFWKKIAARLRQARPDLRLYVDAGDFNLLFDYNPDAALTRMLESGFDPELYLDDPTIVLGPQLYPADYRSESFRESRRALRKPGPTVGFNADSRANLLNPEPVEPWADLPLSWVNFHERYFEDAVGRTDPLEPANPGEYPDVEWRISQLSAPRYHALEGQVAAMANLDPVVMTRGGIRTPTKGFEPWFAQWAAAYRALPAVRMEDVPGLMDPVVARSYDGETGPIFYLLNRLPFPVAGTLELAIPGKLTDAVTGDPVDVSSGIELEPYALRVFTGSAVEGGSFAPVGDGLAWLENLRDALAAADVPDSARADADEALAAADEGRWAAFYLRMQESWRWPVLTPSREAPGE